MSNYRRRRRQRQADMEEALSILFIGLVAGVFALAASIALNP